LFFRLSGKTTDKLLKEAYELSAEPDERELDMLLSVGEQISVAKLSILLKRLGYNSVSLTGWQAGILTNSQNQNAKIEKIFTERILKEFEQGNIVLVTGFQGIDKNENITTLGRGGSDTTAVALAAALKATGCYIFSDVDGIYMADPNRVKEAKKLSNLSYNEMFEIADEGAKVLHNRCIEIGDRFEIPIIAKSTFNNNQGSVINNSIEASGVKSIVKNDDLIYVTISYNKINPFSDLYNKLIHNDIWPAHIINNENSGIKFLINKKQLSKFQSIIEDSFEKVTISYKQVTRISMIGYGITNTSDIFDAVSRIIFENNLSTHFLETNQTKIGIIFDDVLDDKILEEFHKKLIK